MSEPHAQEWERPPGRKNLDLHWRIPGVGVAAEQAWNVLAAQTEPIAVGSAVGESLSRPGLAVLVALHAAHHGRTRRRPLRDLDRALDQIDARTWAEAARLAALLDASEAFAAGLALAPAGERLAGELGLPSVRSPRRRLMAAAQPAGSLGVLRIIEARTVRARARALRAEVLPAPVFMRAASPLARRGRLGLVLAYPGARAGSRLAASGRNPSRPPVARTAAAGASRALTDARSPRGAARFDLWRPEQGGRAPALPRLVAESVRLAWQAGRRELTVMLAVQVASMALVVAEVLVARSLLSGLLHAERANRSLATLVPEVLGLAALTAGLAIAGAVQLHRQRILAELCTRYGEEQVLAVTGSVELAAFDEPSFHDAVARAVFAVRRLPGVINSLAGLLRSVAGALGAVVALTVLAPVFAPVVLFVLVPLWLAARQRGRAFYGFAHGITPQDRERRYVADVLADREAAKEVRAYGLLGFLHARHASLWDERLDRLRSVADRHLTVSVLAGVAASAIVSATLLALIALALTHDISLADAGAAAGAIVLLGQRLTVASSSTGNLSESALFMDDYLALVERGHAPPGKRAPATGPPRSMLIRAENVSFSYAGARGPALRDISIEIAPGEVVALVGENGSGKTTLAKVLAGLYVPGAGRVTWNGVDTASADRDELRRDVAVIFQDFLRYELPARENIALGRTESFPDEEGIRRAARIAGAHDDLERLPQGYDTVLGPAFAGGTDLSQGQWQRLALARAVFRDAPFVILDEPTAALDARAEHDLFAGIRRLLAGRSVLFISHRFSSVRTADRIHVMSAGAIAETGTHHELMGRDGRYAELFRLQAAPYR